MHRTLLLILILLYSCQQLSQKEAAKVNSHPVVVNTTPEPFKLISGDINSDSAEFELAGITASFVNSAGPMQTIHLSQHGKRLVNYIRAIDSSASIIPVPQLIITGIDTVVGFNIQQQQVSRNFFFKIKNNKATYTKTMDPQEMAADSIKKAPAEAEAF